MKNLSIFTMLMFGLAGCSVLTSPIQQPLLEDHMVDPINHTQIGVLAMTSERRVVLINTTSQRFCAEPSPDVAQALTESIRAAIAASAPTATATINAAKDLTTTNSNLFVRSQGVQLFRDASFSLCQAYLNGAINGDSGLSAMNEIYQNVAAAHNETKTPNFDAAKVKEHASLAQSKLNKLMSFDALSGHLAEFKVLNSQLDAVKSSPSASNTSTAENLAATIKDKITSGNSITTNEGNYSTLFTHLLDKTTEIIKLEIPYLAKSGVPIITISNTGKPASEVTAETQVSPKK